jgi:ABC-2 type transport system ATP-binding protein
MLKITNASKCFNNCIAFEEINLQINDCQVVGLLGENGAGKTTLLKAIAGLTNLSKFSGTEGTISFDDVNTENELHEKVVLITEEGSFFSFLTPKAHADFYTDYFNNFDKERFFKLLEYFEVPINKKSGYLSKGQRAKLEIAIGFSKSGKYLLLDEPFLGNDIFTRRDFLKLMCDNLKKDETIIIATHLIDEIENFIDRAVILKKGKVAYDVNIDEIREKGDGLESLMKSACGYDDEKFKRLFG